MYVGLYLRIYKRGVEKYDCKAHAVFTKGFKVFGSVLKCLDTLS